MSASPSTFLSAAPAPASAPLSTPQSPAATTLVEDRPYGRGVTTARPLAEGQVVFDLVGCEVLGTASIYTIDLGDGRHIDGPEVRYLNHSCAPNTYVDTTALRVVALRPIAEGEELTFFYPSTEWDMVGPFNCLCAAEDCVGSVSGARRLPSDVLGRHALNAHIAARLNTGGAE
ncbi:SET domain-containing protein [Streptomyces sp. A3M-1-3]|uniref:SET domain-containing protein-lysine N-methyltransferase n=1 Tax=Streptomyces sp. A3M-1-3 TaxID=2962044 RepID=UPI0020B86914|nr:SET domain-containing methyltransferase [Streptomyces sp. A3M-1-3]MCP3821624.1 SET domain-containing protein [Streptomyces sp. A3M-1-3]